MALKKFVSILMVLGLLISGCQGCSAITYIERQQPDYVNSSRNVDHLLNSVVALVNQNEQGIQAFCTAFFVEENKLATAAHCVAEREAVELLPGLVVEVTGDPRIGAEFRYVDYSQYQLARREVDIQPYTAKVVAFSVEDDVAVLQLMPSSPRSSHYLKLNTNNIRVGEHVYAVGHPAGLVWTLTDGLISRVLRKPNGAVEEIQTSAQIYFGNSGGPLVNESGEVVGVASAIAARQSHLAIFSPIRNVNRLLNGLLPVSLRQ